MFIAAFQANHIHHADSITILDKLAPPETRCGAHTLAEVFSVLTRLPKPRRLLPDQALFFVERVAEKAELVALDAEEYLATVRKAVPTGFLAETSTMLSLWRVRGRRRQIPFTPGT